jgi:hypothetical protein
MGILTERSALLRKVAELDLEDDTMAIVGSLSVDESLHVSIDRSILEEGLLGKRSLVSNTGRVVVDSGSILSNGLTGKSRQDDGGDGLGAHFK